MGLMLLFLLLLTLLVVLIITIAIIDDIPVVAALSIAFKITRWRYRGGRPSFPPGGSSGFTINHSCRVTSLGYGSFSLPSISLNTSRPGVQTFFKASQAFPRTIG